MSRTPLLVVAALIGCSSSPREPTAVPKGRLEHRMANCPSALPTATTRVEDVPGGVALSITSPDPDAQRALRSLAALHQRIGGGEGKRYEHTGMHGGPGTIGYCPIVHGGTHVSYVTIAGGVRVEVRILPGSDAEDLRREVRARLANLPSSIARQ